MEYDLDNAIFNLAVSFVSYSNQSVFLTGKAGTGKTTFLKYIQTNCRKKMAITAPTGVAAINAGGVTLHSFFQIPFGTYLPEMSQGWGGNQNFYNRKQLLHNLRLRQSQREVIRSLELLIIDEVSMVRADLLDAIDAILRSVRRRAFEPFGGVQLLFIGDMYQLPPVVTHEESERLYAYYRSPYFFDAKVMETLNLVPITLDKIYRQQDKTFIQLLNRVRNNCCETEDFDFLNQYYRPTFTPDDKSGYIILTTHNRTAASINDAALARLPGKIFEIHANIQKQFPENAYPADVTLRLKIGAQIMFIKNDKGEKRRYFNGKIGTIKHINATDKKIEITFPDEPDSIVIETETWNNIRYEYNQEHDEVEEKNLGSFSQYPIRLAWAVTIHKSQGLTFEKAVIDAGRSFAPGQVYVALSRLTGLDGMVLHSRIFPESIRSDMRILEFSKQQFSKQEYEHLLEEAQNEYARRLLLSAYDWNNPENTCTDLFKSFTNRQMENKGIAVKTIANLLDGQIELHNIAKKFNVLLEALLNANPVNYSKIRERNLAAADWFLKRMEGDIARLKTHIEEFNGKSRVKKYLTDAQQLLKVFEKKKTTLERSKTLTEALSEKGGIREAMIAFNAPIITESAPIKKAKPTKGASKMQSLEGYKAGKTIAEIAKERNLAESTIVNHLTSFIASGEVPVGLFVSREGAAEIIEASKNIKPFSLSVLREKLGNRFDFPALRAAMTLVENEESATT